MIDYRGVRTLFLLIFLSGGVCAWCLYGLWRLGVYVVHHLQWVVA